MKNKIGLTAAIALAVLLTLVGCSTIPAASGSDKSTSSSASSPSPAKNSPAATATPAPDDANATHTFGQTVTYKDGVTLTVSAPQPFTPDQYAAGATFPTNILLTVMIKNGSSQQLSPLVYGQMTSAGVAGTQVFDSSHNIANAPTAVILPGGSITWTEGWSVKDPNQLQYQLSPSTFKYQDSIFTLG